MMTAMVTAEMSSIRRSSALLFVPCRCLDVFLPSLRAGRISVPSTSISCDPRRAKPRSGVRRSRAIVAVARWSTVRSWCARPVDRIPWLPFQTVVRPFPYPGSIDGRTETVEPERKHRYERRRNPDHTGFERERSPFPTRIETEDEPRERKEGLLRGDGRCRVEEKGTVPGEVLQGCVRRRGGVARRGRWPSKWRNGTFRHGDDEKSFEPPSVHDAAWTEQDVNGKRRCRKWKSTLSSETGNATSGPTVPAKRQKQGKCELQSEGTIFAPKGSRKCDLQRAHGS